MSGGSKYIFWVLVTTYSDNISNDKAEYIVGRVLENPHWKFLVSLTYVQTHVYNTNNIQKLGVSNITEELKLITLFELTFFSIFNIYKTNHMTVHSPESVRVVSGIILVPNSILDIKLLLNILVISYVGLFHIFWILLLFV